MAWQEFAGLNVPVVEDFLVRFEAIVNVGDEADRDILESMVRHEAAILRWATMERDGIVDGITRRCHCPTALPPADLNFPVQRPAPNENSYVSIGLRLQAEGRVLVVQQQEVRHHPKLPPVHAKAEVLQ